MPAGACCVMFSRWPLCCVMSPWPGAVALCQGQVEGRWSQGVDHECSPCLVGARARVKGGTVRGKARTRTRGDQGDTNGPQMVWPCGVWQACKECQQVVCGGAAVMPSNAMKQCQPFRPLVLNAGQRWLTLVDLSQSSRSRPCAAAGSAVSKGRPNGTSSPCPSLVYTAQHMCCAVAV
jgi:hypothetical protein